MTESISLFLVGVIVSVRAPAVQRERKLNRKYKGQSAELLSRYYYDFGVYYTIRWLIFEYESIVSQK